jgi:hypothetical protein
MLGPQKQSPEKGDLPALDMIMPQGSQGGRRNLIPYYLQEAGCLLYEDNVFLYNTFL